MASADLICQIADVPRTTRNVWATRGWLSERSRSAYHEIDAIELAAFKRLSDSLGRDDLAVVWPGMRADLPHRALAKVPIAAISEVTLDALVDLRAKQGWLLDDRQEVGRLIVPDHVFRLVSLTGPVSLARRAFERATASPST